MCVKSANKLNGGENERRGKPTMGKYLRIDEVHCCVAVESLYK